MTVLQIGYDGLVIGMLYAMVGLGMVLIFRTTNVLNFGQGAIATLAGYLSWQLTEDLGLPYPVTFLVATLCGALAGTLLGTVITVFMTKASVFEKSVATLGFAFVLAWVNRNYFGEQTQSGPVVFTWSTRIGGVAVSGMELFVIGVAAVAVLAVFWLLHRTRLGLNMRALSQDQQTARSFGVSERRVSILSWFIGSALGSASGVLVGGFLQLDHSVMTTIMIQSFAALVLGGFGSAIGAVVGGVVLGISSTAITTYLDSNFKNTVILLVVLIILVVRPSGLVGMKTIVVPETGQSRSLPSLPRPGSLRRPLPLVGIVVLAALLVALPFIPHPFTMVTYAVCVSTAIAVIALGLLTGYVGELSLGHGAFVTVGAYASALVVQRIAPLPYPATIVVAALAAGLFGAIAGWATLRLSSYYLAVATLFLTYMVAEIILQFDDVTGGATGISVPVPDLLGLTLRTDRDIYYLAVLTLGIVVVTVSALVRSKAGRIWVAVRDAPSAAAANGIAVNRHKVIAFAISAAIAGIAGSLLATTLSHVGSSDFGLNWSIMLILAVIVGGTGSLPGALFGAAIIVLVPEALAHTRGMGDLVLGATLVLVLILMPGGLPALMTRIRNAVTRARGPAAGRGPGADPAEPQPELIHDA